VPTAEKYLIYNTKVTVFVRMVFIVDVMLVQAFLTPRTSNECLLGENTLQKSCGSYFTLKTF